MEFRTNVRKLLEGGSVKVESKEVTLTLTLIPDSKGASRSSRMVDVLFAALDKDSSGEMSSPSPSPPPPPRWTSSSPR